MANQLKKGTFLRGQEMGRLRIKINIELVHQLRRVGLGWQTIARRYYGYTNQEISWMTLKRRLIEAELAAQEGNNGH